MYGSGFGLLTPEAPWALSLESLSKTPWGYGTPRWRLPIATHLDLRLNTQKLGALRAGVFGQLGLLVSRNWEYGFACLRVTP